MKYHDNEVKLVYNEDSKGNGYKLTKKGSFLIKDFSVIDGQDPDGNISKDRSVVVNTDGFLYFVIVEHKLCG